MTDLFVDNYIIDANIKDILEKVRSELTNGKLSVIEDKGEYIRVTCPWHSEGRESHASCSVYTGDSDIKLGTAHCFTCGRSSSLADFIGACFDSNVYYGKRWLIRNFGTMAYKPSYNLTSIDLNQEKEDQIIDESILSTFESYHPYMKQRKLSDEIIEKFEVKYDPLSKCLVFPVRDKFGRLSFLTRRSVNSKRFIIDQGIKKEVYLLYDAIKNRYPEVYIAESQINALVAESYGKKAVATFGCGCPDYQINDLNNTDVRHYIIAFDPDPAGLKGTLRLCDNLSKSKFISVMILPEGKDIGDLTKEEFDNCEIVDKDYFIKHIPDYYTK